MPFTLAPQLQKDTYTIGHFPLCKLLINRDKTFPWFILVPQVAHISELHHLTEVQQNQFIKESSLVAESLSHLFDADKLNIAALGNVVKQLHIHHIVRYKNDDAWPAPIWGQQKEIYYSQQEIDAITKKVNEHLQKTSIEYTSI